MQVDTSEGLSGVYRHHHESGNRLGASVLVESRGKFLRDRIGTGKTVLDIGCRDGVLTKEYSEGNEVLGLDIDDNALAIAGKELGIQTKLVDLNGNWGVSENYFDFVVAGEVMEHLYFPNIVLGKITHALKNDGVLLGSVPNAFSLQMRTRLFLGKKKATPLNDPTHINHFSHKELKRILEKHFDEVIMYPEGNYAWLDKWFPGWFSFMMFFEAKYPHKS